ncbi:class I SAM-dependent methyltransferase [Chelativorans sp. AA-79]|uniref:class I SAM-dependent methyltransferase n=1 Tax=Chelativorans sp. AA-79 TaxID=3028735 RepID=UPI0023F8E918|nr:class I SAM-dependent methyltransferase [Chelativorans sp. AA-79]WEX07886.1 class I SAM-dependent methyltransferase [Chelativorans sp. AA-79]
MSRLSQRIQRLIEATGPIGVDVYMALCLFDPQDGYYTTREPFGATGDFTTAPEVSQMFGELLAVWLYTAWKACGAPGHAVFAEIGPGRGTLMKDMLRTLSRLDPNFVAAHRFAMVETSPRLAAVQKETLVEAPAAPEWFSRVDDLPEGPLFITGNELFDAVPVKQYVKVPAGWCERKVGQTDDGALAFKAGPGAPDPSLLPKDAEKAPEGTIFETAPAREALMDMIAERLARAGGAGLFIDYGYEGPALGETLQAVRRHAFDDVLAHPGEADLTAHVDFSALGQVARTHGLVTRLMTQGEFLLGLGLLERAGRLGAGKDPQEQERIRGEVERLAGLHEMGTLFKAMAVLPTGVEVPPF